MNVSRRAFLASASTLGFASLLLPRGALAKMVFYPLGFMRRNEFVARIKEWFYLYNADATHQSNLQLIRVVGAGSSKQVEMFTLILRSDRQDLAMPSGTYEVAGEPISLFIQHTHEHDGRQYYRAAFALLL